MELVDKLSCDAVWRQHGDIEWLRLERPGASLLQYFSGVETVCLIDALEGGRAVMRIETDELLALDAVISSHHIGVAEALQLATAINQLPPQLLIYGVPDQPESYGQLSAMLAEDLRG